MHLSYTPYIIPMLVAAVISVALAAYVWRRRSAAPGAMALVLLMLALTEWLLLEAVCLVNNDLSARLIWAKVEYIGIVSVPVLWLVFVLQYTGKQRWLTRRNLALLAICPIITLLLVWTNEAHRLIWAEYSLHQHGSVMISEKTYGVWFWVHTAYSYSLVLTGAILVLRWAISSFRLYRHQAVVMLIGALVPLVGNMPYILHLRSVQGIDPTPLAFTVSGCMLALGLFRFRLLDIVPIARDTVIQGMNDGLMVLDAQNRIVDINPAIEGITGLRTSEVIGRPVAQILSCWSTLTEQHREEMKTQSEITLGEGGEKRHYDLRISPLYGRLGSFTGQVVTLHDVSWHKKAEERERRIAELDRVHAEVSDSFLKEASINSAANYMLKRVGELLDVCRTYIFHYSEDGKYMDNVYEWRADGISPQIDNLQQIPSETFPYWNKEVVNNRIINAVDIKTLPKEERAILEPQGIKSILIIPLFMNNKLFGFVGFDEIRYPREWYPDEVLSLRTIADTYTNAVERKKVEDQLEHSFIDLAETISRTVSSRDPYTASHQRRVAELARLVGEKIGLDKNRLMGLYIGGLLHDIGKISTPESILSKPGKLSDEEWNLIRTHAKQGYEIVNGSAFPWPVADMALHHHERLDGSGYPDGISGDELSLEVRILGVCDVVEAMSSHRPYRPARSRKEVVEEIKGGRGTKYDADVVDIMLQIIESGEFELGWE